MFLKRLESVGFKSFAERIKVEFVPGVTAVVGPNGSGKSNITDAIRWVLGEQSAKSLRGSKMEDIIFQGSDTRRPVNVAEVTLILDNSDQTLPIDYEEVSVTRRVYRSGESEFYLNKQACRLKDIIELFMDSGLGREAFSIISQGKVEEILSSKAEERRTIFEEAAGVLKYKQRKNKAEFKLMETEENISRVDDIIYEIKQQIDPLSKQAKIAEDYIEKKEQLKEKEISLIITEIESLNKKWQTILSDIKKWEDEELALKTSILNEETILDKERVHLNDMDAEIDGRQEELLNVTKQLEQLEGKKQVFQERLKHYASNQESLEEQKLAFQKQMQKQDMLLQTEVHQLEKLKVARNQLNNQINQIETDTFKQDTLLPKQIEEQKAEYIEYLNKQAAKRNEKQSIHQQLEQLSGKTTYHSTRFRDLKQKKQNLQTQWNKTNEEVEKRQFSTKEKKTNIQTIKDNLSKERVSYNNAQEKLSQGYQTIAKFTSRKEMLEEMKEDFQGFFHGVKNILLAKKNNQLSHIHGAVIELIDVPSHLVTAIETTLAGSAQHIVVKDDESARDAIAWLKKTNRGRATFLPLTSIKARFVSSEMRRRINNHPGFIGIASDLVTTTEPFHKVIDHLMGHVIIAKTLKDANDIANRLNRKNRIVTLDGDVVNPGGSMSGGAKKKTNQSLFTREKDLAVVQAKLTDFNKKASSFKEKIQQQQTQIEQMENELVITEEEVKKEQQNIEQVNTSKRAIEVELNQLMSQLKLYNQDKEQHEEDRDKLIKREKDIDVELTEIKKQLEGIQLIIDKLTNKEQSVELKREQNRKEFHQLQIRSAETEEKVRNREYRITEFKKQIDESKESINEIESSLATMGTEEEQQEKRKQLEKEMEIKTAETNKVTLEIQDLREKRTDKTKHFEDMERELKEKNKQHQLFLQKLQQKEVEANRLDVDLENRLSLLQKEYVMTYEKACERYQKTNEPNNIEMQVKDLKQAIKELGTVNLGAIEEYDRIKERYTFLNDQKTDLVEAERSLYAIINEMDQVMIERFETSFTAIKHEFSIVFKSLFGGGKAELKLTEPDNILDTGVEIIAQPPGKKLQHLGLLSGGERALTAIALLFSILRVRPVPFCVLDEVEAALDEANVVRFAKYLKQHSKDTQFIVITHRQGTMEEADVLYGITMQESGVSRLISVQLETMKQLVNS